jgi:hypothetical protein
MPLITHERGQDQHTYHHLDQHDHVHGQVLEALGDRRRHGVKKGRSQGQADAEQVIGAGGQPTLSCASPPAPAIPACSVP